MKHQRLTKLCVALAAAGIVPFAHATDGYFANGYGMKSIGMGGAAVAVAQEAFGGAVNPATASFLGNEWQLGVSWFSPRRDAERTGSGMAGIDGSVDSGSTNFFVPEFGVNWKYRPDLSLGVTVYGNGGMNTDYDGGQISAQSACGFMRGGQGSPYNLLCGSGQLGMDMMQLLIAPYASWQPVKGQSFGIAPVIAYQRFKAEGLQVFDNPAFSVSPGNVTNNGYDDSWGVGVRVGYMGQFTEQFAFGATYSTKISMGNFDKYKGLFAQEGGFDIPSNFAVGVAFRPTSQWLIALDFERIFYDDVPSVNNPARVPRLLRAAADGRHGPARLLHGRQHRRGLRLAERRRVEDRRPVRAQRPVDAARRLQPHRQPDPAAGRDAQHHRPRRGRGPVDARRHLQARQGVRDHRHVHVRAGQLGDRPQPVRRLRRAADDDGDDLDAPVPGRHRLLPQVLTRRGRLDDAACAIRARRFFCPRAPAL